MRSGIPTMRSSIFLVASLFAACSAPPDADDWSVIQRDRLERLHRPRDPARAVAAVLAQEPPKPGQEVRHIDQQEPRLRAFQGPVLTAQATVGFGTVAARVDHTALSDRADARFLRLGLEAQSGAGLQVDLWNSEAELFAGRRINDGDAPADADASLSGVDAFPHLRWSALQGALRLPVRVGVFADSQRLSHERAGVEREWLGVGPRVIFEPTWRLLGDRDSALELVGSLGGDVGGSWFSEHFHGGDDRDFTVRWTGEAGLWLRALSGHWHGDLGYRLRHTTLGSVDTELYGDRNRTELQQQQVFVGLGLTW